MAESKDPRILWSEVDSGIQAYEAWARRVREVSHHALFFLGFLYPVYRGFFRVRSHVRATAAVQAYAPHAFAQIRRMFPAPFEPAELGRIVEQIDDLKEPRTEWKVRRYKNRAKEGLDAANLSKQISDSLEDVERLDLGSADRMRSQFRELLTYVQPQKWWLQFREHFRFVEKNLSVVWTLLVSVALLAGVEAVRSLLLDQRSSLPWLLALAFAPFLISRFLIFSNRHGDKVPVWDIGGRAFRSYRAMALEPGRLIDRWPAAEQMTVGDGLPRLWGKTRSGVDALQTKLPAKVSKGLGGKRLLFFILFLAAALLLWVLNFTSGRYVIVLTLSAALLFWLWSRLRVWAASLEGHLPAWIFRGLCRMAGWHLLTLVPVAGILAAVTYRGVWNVTAVTIFLLFFFCYGAYILAHLIDFSDFLSRRPMRLLTLLGCVFVLMGLLTGLGRQTFVGVFVAFASVFLWMAIRRQGILWGVAGAILILFAVGVLLGHETDLASQWPQEDERGLSALERRNPPAEWHLRLTPSEGDSDTRCGDGCSPWPYPNSEAPVVLMAASGGGSRAAIYTGFTLLRLHGVDSRSSKERAPDAPPEYPTSPEVQNGLREIASNLQAISSVSGGSLANAAYMARLLRAREKRAAEEEELEGLGAALSRDFLLPPLLGAIYPRGSRGDVIECSWEGADRAVSLSWRRPLRVPKQVLGKGLAKLCQWLAKGTRNQHEERVLLERYSLNHLATGWRRAVRAGEPRPPFPLPLFNSTSLDGHAVVLSSLGKEFYTRKDHREAFESRSENDVALNACGDTEVKNLYRRNESRRCAVDGDAGINTWVYYRDAIYSLEDLLPRYNPRLSSAVRASANFPFGFPLVTVKTTKRLPFNPMRGPRTTERPRKIRLTDGGALSNSGLWTMFNLLMNEELVGELKRRGVLLLIVDASKMPEYPTIRRRFGTLWRTIGDQTTIGQHMHRLMFDLLVREYGERIKIHQVDVIPTKRYNVLTTWALAERSVDKLRKSFRERFRAEELVAKWHALEALEPIAPEGVPMPKETVFIERPPLD